MIGHQERIKKVRNALWKKEEEVVLLDDWSYMSRFFNSLPECEHGAMSHMALLHTVLFMFMG